jgi:hypothetical protein
MMGDPKAAEYNTLLNLGLGLMASKEPNFFDALGASGQKVMADRSAVQAANRKAKLDTASTNAEIARANTAALNTHYYGQQVQGTINAAKQGKVVGKPSVDNRGYAFTVMDNGTVVPLRWPDKTRVEMIPERIQVKAADALASAIDKETGVELQKEVYREYWEQVKAARRRTPLPKSDKPGVDYAIPKGSL